MSEQADNIRSIWINKAKSLGYTTAANLMASLYEVDFEAYMIAFELCDSEGETLDYFTFPIMPTELSIEDTIPTKVENTFGGVNSISSNVYVPKNIHLSGNFGRQFKLLIRNKVITPFVNNKIIQERDYGVGGVQREQLEISNQLKTGYGCFKVLQSIINRSVEVDQYGECNKLYMYNLAYGESYIVKAESFRGSQSVNNNAIWNYDLVLKSVCPLYLDSHKKGKTIKVFTMSTAQSSLNNTLNGVRQTFNINN